MSIHLLIMRCQTFSTPVKALSFLLIVLYLQSSTVNGAKILGVLTSHSKSHLIVHMSVMKALAERGHDITVVTSIKPTVTHPSIKTITIPVTKEQEEAINQGLDKMASQKNSLYDMIFHMFSSMTTMITMQYDVVQDERFTKLYNEKFDLVIMGYFFNDFQLGIAAKFNCPLIISWMGASMKTTDDFVGNPYEISYVPQMNLAVNAGEAMNFKQRFGNFLTSIFFEVFSLIFTPKMKNYYTQMFPKENFPTFEDMRKNVSLVFCNNHFSEGVVRPNVPAIVEIGGIQIKDKPDPLPKDIGEFLDSAKQNGAILLSLGSNLKGSNIRPHIVKALFHALSSLKQKVIWKWEDLNNLPGKSSNILYKKWLPQDDILAHPNLRLFITHAGKGGIAEAQYHAVPMVALPVFADQPGNADKMVLSGYGQQLNILSLTADEFKKTILEVLENPKYKENIKQFSQLYRDRPITAKESVVYWTEYVLRHRGAKHMQSPLVHLNSIQSLSLDVIGAIVLAFYIICKIIKIISKFVVTKMKPKKQNEKKKSNKKVKNN